VKIGYFVTEFPNQTHAFFWREAMALEEAGTPVVFLSSRRPPDAACPHDFGAEARARTHYVFPPRTGPALAFLLARPARLAAAIGYGAGLKETPLKRKAVMMGFILCAADMALVCKREGVRHVHFHSCADAAHIGALANILDGISYSLTLHGDLPVYGTDHAAKMARAALVTAVTTPLSEQVRGVRPDRVAPVIWMGVDMARFTPPARKAPQTGPIHAVTIARLNMTKGHRYFLEAMAAAVAEGIDLCYSIAGDGPYRDALVTEIAALGLQDRVTLLGAIDQTRVLELLREADLFALNSIGQGEAAPVAVMEAMACGLPVLCSRIGGTADMITDDADGFLVDQKDAAGILAVLRRLAHEDGLRARIGAAARIRAVAAFDHHVKARELQSAIAAACAALDYKAT
jgi:glycosyltransferase involved in cell wall biosynthesis